MSSQKYTKLSMIKDEVKDFHPLLNKLFKKLPGIIDVEYTHGMDEMGADFVLSKRNDIFENTEYIGVIAKIGKIHQDYGDIERQIEECEVPRFFFGGKDEIRISEVWVVITEHITGGAQKKIHEKYKARKINFIHGDRLEKLIDEHIPTYWFDLNLEVGEYLTSIREKNREIDRNLSLVPITGKELYIEHDIYEVDNDEYNIKKKHERRKPKKIDIYNKIDLEKIILIEGGMGSGKSKLIRHLIEHYSVPETYLENKFVPVVTTFKALLDRYDSNISKLIQDNLGEKLINEENNEIKCLIFIDAIDEKDMSPEDQIEALAMVVNNICQLENVKAFITSRFLSELDNLCNLEKKIYRCEIRPLSLKKTIEFVTAICEKLNISDRIIEDMKKSQLFKELPRSPISAILLAKLLNENSEDLPSNMTELYSKYMELVLGRWDIEKGLQSQKEYQALSNILMEISKYIIDNEMTSIAIDEVKQIFKIYLNDRNLDIDAELLFNKMIKRCEIMAIDYNKNTLFFKHRTFAEFLYAKLHSTNHELKIDKRAFELYWMNIFFFYLGILKDCPKYVDVLINMEVSSEPQRLLKIINMANYFLAAYTTPYKFIVNGLMKTMIEAALLYKDIIAGNIDSPFAMLPRMHVLCIFQIFIRQSYSYEFLRKAMEEVALEINYSDNDDEIKAYSLFFLNVAYIDISPNQSFDFLLKEHLGKLPIDLSLALFHEFNNIKERTLLMKKHEKYLKKLLKGNKSLISYMHKISELSIKSLLDSQKKK